MFFFFFGVISFNPFLKFLGLGNLASDFLGLIFGSGIFWGFHHPRHLKYPPFPWALKAGFFTLSVCNSGKICCLLLQPLQNVEPYLAFCNNYSNITTNFKSVASVTCFLQLVFQCCNSLIS